MKKSLFPLIVAATILLFYGCASKQAYTPITERMGQQPAVEQQRSEGTGEKGGISEEELARAERERQRLAAQSAAAASAHLPDIYFDFDSYIVRNQDVPALKDIADWLSKNRAVKVVIEGYCDERGTTEYNLALGQKRAEAAKDFLVSSGVAANRIMTNSYGKEAPVDAGHTEEAWAKNRRDHFASQQ
jgi:peptidoglycan-associated lipoprotein